MNREQRSSTEAPDSIDTSDMPAGIPERWQWHYHALEKLRDHLVDDLCAKVAEAAERAAPRFSNFRDGATEQSAPSANFGSEELDAVHEVEFAMDRILAGIYGICERSGKAIDEERLRAIPWTRFTKEVQDTIEERGRAARGNSDSQGAQS